VFFSRIQQIVQIPTPRVFQTIEHWPKWSDERCR